MINSKKYDLANVKLVIFDFDETLAFTREANFKAYEDACSSEGIKINFEEYLKTSGLNWRESIRQFARTGDEEQIKRIHDRKNDVFPEHVSHIEPNEEIVKLLYLLKDKFRLCLATTGSRPSILRGLDRLGIKDMFDLILTSDEVIKGKPAPDVFLKAAEHFKVLPEECFVFEDSEVGFQACEAAKMGYFRVNKCESGRMRQNQGES